MSLDTRGEALFGELKGLLIEISRMEIAEFELEYRDVRIVVRKNGNGHSGKERKLQPAPAVAIAVLPGKTAENTKQVTSPLTGVFYLSPSPTSPPFVEAGDVIEEGQVVGMVEAMKVFNEIKAEWSGRVVRIFARSGELVQTGQALLELTPLS
ncbi:MAG: biotin carboxyl carrier domain-containing protein [Chloroflexi bacterium]|nr:biotin carboxyl carrier domain-containing protein [Chloroflexota bacterium]